MQPIVTRRAALTALLASGLPAHARTAWPSKPLKFVVPYPAGGSPDNFTRQISEQLAQRFGVSVVVENKPGAGGLLGLRSVSQGSADGHLYSYVTSGQVTLSAINPKFDLLKELKPVARLSASPFVALVNSTSPYKTMGELISAVQAAPGKLSFGTAGTGSPAHMAVEYLEESAGNFKALHIPFKGAVESINAILGSQIDFTISVLGASLPHIRAGRLRALGVTTAQRSAALPDVPTIAEAGGGRRYAFQSWGGFMMHASTPDDIVAQAAAAFAAAMKTPAMQRYSENTGTQITISESPAAFLAQLLREVTAEQAIVKRLGIVPD